jgi:biotin operon repressor
METCPHCAAVLTTNEIAISLRLLGRDGKNLRCRDCLAKELKVSPEIIDRKIRQFRDMGCPLFV